MESFNENLKLAQKKNFVKKIRQKYVGVQSWKAVHLPTLEIRVEQ